MPVLFSCPHCGAQTDVDDTYLGQSGPCYSCGKTVTVPHVPPSASSQRTSPKSKSNNAATIGVVLAIVFVSVLAGVAVIGMVILFLRPAVATFGETAQRRQCEDRLKEIALAMQAYHDDHGTYPPAYIPDSSGKPMHSWRVLLLPYLDYEWLYEMYNFREPWDSEQNLSVAQQMPHVYGCPADPDAIAIGETNYMVIVGPETMFPGAQPMKLSQISDGSANTILVVETPLTGATWTEPKDIDATQMMFQVNGSLGREIGSMHPGGAYVVTADGQTHFVSDSASTTILRALITPNGGEGLTPNDLRSP